MPYLPQLIFGVLALIYAGLAAKQRVASGEFGISERIYLIAASFLFQW
jgi:hypothetical protein